MKLSLTRDWTEFLSLLISHRVKFLLIGGHAVAAHAEPRFTEDLDVFVEASVENAERLRSALEEFGFGAVLPAASELARSGKVWMLGRKPQRIDILTKISGVRFADAWANRVDVQFPGGVLFVIGRDDLIKNKRASAREKDLRDLAMLEGSAKPSRRKRR